MAELGNCNSNPLVKKFGIFRVGPFTEIVCQPLLYSLPSWWAVTILFFPGKWPGQCPCKEGYAGEKCNHCQFGYKGYPACVRCECSRAGSVNEDPCSEPCLCKVCAGVKGDPEFPLRCARKEHIPQAQKISSWARQQDLNRTLLARTFLTSMRLCHIHVLGLRWARPVWGFFWWLLGNGHIVQRYFCDFQDESKYCISEAWAINLVYDILFQLNV